MSVVSTIPERCKRCYCCVRDCPANAIQIREGQAVVLQTRCIGCGNCVKVCTQSAKSVVSGVPALMVRLADGGENIALLAPSFPAAFPGVEPMRIVGALRAAGFTRVVEVAFGADMVSAEYRRVLEDMDGPVITTPCPAVVEYVEKYEPALIPHLAPIVSPMIAAGRMARERYGAGAFITFLGPCIAKKVEVLDPAVKDAVDVALTFDELAALFSEAGIDPAAQHADEFDPPRANLGRIYPITGGLLKSAGIRADVMDEEVIVVEGRQRVLNILGELARGNVRSRLIDILFCEGCINGPGLSSPLNFFERRESIITHVRARCSALDGAAWRRDMTEHAAVPLARGFADKRMDEEQPADDTLAQILASMRKTGPEDMINCGACGYDTCRNLAVAVAQGIAEREMCLQYTIDNLERSHRELAEAQAQLIHTEKLASVGQLAAGVAHEINNPLGTILIYSHLLRKQLQDDDARREDLSFIIAEAERCKNIVGSLLNFARQGKLSVDETSAAELVRHIETTIGKRGDLPEIDIVALVDPDLPPLHLDGEQMKQVLLNIAVNACDAMPRGGTLSIAARPAGQPGSVAFTITDSGEGIPKEHLPRLFTPFFTTKPAGKGTGLGLPIAYGIVKLHHGSITVRSEVGKGTTFTVTIPADVRPLAVPHDTPAPTGAFS